ncbi:MAG TPA: alanine racemase, partial [Nitrospirota bacterium]|nr:alanine racemase [Nitrospirota bacterium]
MQHRPTVAEIDLSALAHNLREVRRLASGRGVLAVVKADAYGHGAVEVARALEKAGVEMFGVALVEEGVILREAGIKTPVLVLGGVFEFQADDLVKYDIAPTLFTFAQAEAFSAAAMQAGTRMAAHVKVDTGMGRVGMPPDEAVPFIKLISGFPGIELQGIMTHLADVGGRDKSFSEFQINEFRVVLERLEDDGITFPFVHAAGSAAIMEFNPAHFNMVRPGIMLYGCYPSEHMMGLLTLKPVMTLKTHVMHIK